MYSVFNHQFFVSLFLFFMLFVSDGVFYFVYFFIFFLVFFFFFQAEDGIRDGRVTGVQTCALPISLKDLIAQHADLLRGKIVVDPSNPVAPDGNGGVVRTLPDDQSSGSVVAGLLPAEAPFVKAFGTLGAESLASEANRTPRAVLFYATDDDQAAAAIERLISAAGFDPVKAGGVDAALRIEASGDLHQFGGLNGKVVDASEARTAVAAAA